MDYDGLVAETPTNRHVLPSDSRFYQMVRATTRIQRFVNESALKRFDEVYYHDAEANHDPASATHRREMWSLFYSKNDRIDVITDPRPHVARTWGDVMLGYSHGHLVKPEDLPGLFAAEHTEEWAIAGKHTKRYIHFGHKHASLTGEKDGAMLRQHPTLASRSAHASRHGWTSLRRAHAEVYDKRKGAINMVTVGPDMIDLSATADWNIPEE